MITPAQYWISGGNLGGGLGRSISVELGLKVNRSTKENTLVCRGEAEERVAEDGGVGFDVEVEEVREDEEESNWAMTVREDEVEDRFS
jgi:hypothetical protein